MMMKMKRRSEKRPMAMNLGEMLLLEMIEELVCCVAAGLWAKWERACVSEERKEEREVLP